MAKFNFSFVPKTRVVQTSNLKKQIPSEKGYHFDDLKRICVYAHFYDKEELPFYIGQGTISRAFNFSKDVRNKSWKEKVKDISKINVEILYIDISIEDSIKLEKELINKYGKLIDGTGCLTNENDGGKNAQIGKDNYFYGKSCLGENNGNYGNKYEQNPISKSILQIDIFGNIVKEWASAKEAEEKGGFCSSPISACCYKKRHIHKGYQWIFKSDYDKNKNYEYTPGQTNNRIYIAFPKDSIFDMSKVIVIYNKQQAEDLGFSMRNINQVAHGDKKSHKGFIFRDYFKLPKEEKLMFKDLIVIDE